MLFGKDTGWRPAHRLSLQLWQLRCLVGPAREQICLTNNPARLCLQLETSDFKEEKKKHETNKKTIAQRELKGFSSAYSTETAKSKKFMSAVPVHSKEVFPLDFSNPPSTDPTSEHWSLSAWQTSALPGKRGDCRISEDFCFQQVLLFFFFPPQS